MLQFRKQTRTQMDEKVIRVLIADDHALLRAGLKRILKDEADFRVVVEVGSGTEVLEAIKKVEIDFAICDLTMPEGGIELIKTLKKTLPALKILVLSMHPEDRFAVRAFKAGASGYMTKESAPELLVTAIRRIIAGGRYISSQLAESLAEALSENKTELPHKVLSDREYQIFVFLAQGRKVSEVAKELFLSVHTVNTYRSRIMDKMGLKSNVDLTHYAMEHKLID